MKRKYTSTIDVMHSKTGGVKRLSNAHLHSNFSAYQVQRVEEVQEEQQQLVNFSKRRMRMQVTLSELFRTFRKLLHVWYTCRIFCERFVFRIQKSRASELSYISVSSLQAHILRNLHTKSWKSAESFHRFRLENQ